MSQIHNDDCLWINLINPYIESGLCNSWGWCYEAGIYIGKSKDNVMRNIMESYRHVFITKTTLVNQAGMYGAAAIWVKQIV